MNTTFAGWSTSEIDRNKLANDFNTIDYGESTFHLSKQVFHHDEAFPDEDFEYRLCIREEQWDMCEGKSGVSVELLMLPLAQKIYDKVANHCSDYEGIDDIIHSDVFAADAISSGYYIQFGREYIEYETLNTEEEQRALEQADELVIIAATIYESANSLRGFLLDRYVNRIGTTGWDMINEWCYNGIDATTAALNRWKEEQQA